VDRFRGVTRRNKRWRKFYGYGGLATDRHPAFSLDAEPGIPATLGIAYPEWLSRGWCS
jgi:hypothetical protein